MPSSSPSRFTSPRARSSAIVADPDGVILAARGTRTSWGRRRGVRLVEGARWSEDAPRNQRDRDGDRRAVPGRRHRRRALRGAEQGPLLLRNSGPGPVRRSRRRARRDRGHPRARARDRGRGRGRGSRARAVPPRERLCARRRRSLAGDSNGSCIGRPGRRSFVETSGLVGAMNSAARATLRSIDGALEGALTCERLFGVPYAELQLLAQQGARGIGSRRAAPATASSSTRSRRSGENAGRRRASRAGVRGARALASIVVAADAERVRSSRVRRDPGAGRGARAREGAGGALRRDRAAGPPLGGDGHRQGALRPRDSRREPRAAAGPFVPLNCGRSPRR